MACIDGPGASCDVRGFCASLLGGCSDRASLSALFSCCSVRAALAALAFSAKQNFSILRLFGLCSSTVLQATKFMRRSFGS